MFVSPRALLAFVFAAGAAIAAPTHDGADLIPRAPGALSCRAIASGPWTLERERQQRQGLWVSPQKSNSFRLIGATNGAKEGQDLTFVACDSEYMGFKQSTEGEEKTYYGQLRTEKGTCVAAVPATKKPNALQFVSKACPGRDDASSEGAWWKMTASAYNGLTYKNKNYRVSFATKQQPELSYDLLRSGLLYATSKTQFSSGTILYRAFDA